MPRFGREVLRYEVRSPGIPQGRQDSLFNILTGAGVAVDKYATGRSQPNIGVAKVVDPRIDRLAVIFRPKKIT